MKKRLKYPFRNIWRLVFFVNTFISLVPLYPFFLVWVNDEKHFRKAFRLKKVWAWLMLYPLGVRWIVEQEEELSDGPYVICPNHTSYLDIIVSYLTFPLYYHYLGKVELTRWFLFNIFFKKMNIPIDRENGKRAYSALDRAKKDLDKGISIAIFPEGTVSPNAPELCRFKNGAFKLAIDKQVPVLPVTFINNWNILPGKNLSYKGGGPGRSKVIIHKPLLTTGMGEGDYEALKNQVIGIIENRIAAETGMNKS
ncbi:MAG: 1-acyl-sn-glycerol-3-phosphate acyltransferase [Bacteroidia bacterium]|nr:1-acyl-sn-glycerol-3-phosphate acyltransferase [Bacteroidia bacterium]